MSKLWDRIKSGYYDAGRPPRKQYNDDLIEEIKNNHVGTFKEIEVKIKEVEDMSEDVFQEAQNKHWEKQGKLHEEFRHDLYEHFGVLGHPKAQMVHDLAKERTSCYETMIDYFGELVVLIK